MRAILLFLKRMIFQEDTVEIVINNQLHVIWEGNTL